MILERPSGIKPEFLQLYTDWCFAIKRRVTITLRTHKLWSTLWESNPLVPGLQSGASPVSLACMAGQVGIELTADAFGVLPA